MVERYPASFTFIRLAVILALTVAAIAAPNITYANTPAAVPSITAVPILLNSTVGSKFIGSKRVQSLQLSLNNGTSTNFTLNFYNRSGLKVIRKYSFLSLGSWSHLTGTKETLSCSLVFEASTSTFGFLQFISNIESFQMYANISLASLRGFLPAANSSADQTVIADNFLLGAGCYLGQLFGTLYSISTSGNMLTPVSFPQNWSNQATIESFNYAISNNALYRYNQLLNQYDQIYSFSNFSQYLIFEYQGRILVSASNIISNATVANVTTYRVSQAIYLLIDASSGPSLIGRIDVEGDSNLTYIHVFTSPKLTKFAYEYTPIGNSSAIVVVKSVDYISNKVIDLMWKDYAKFLQTRAIATYGQICFGDNFLVVRNGTAKAKNSSLVAAEDGYQYVNNQIIHFNRYMLNSVSDLLKWLRLMVDPYYDSLLYSINFYQFPTNIQFEQIYFQNYAATKKIVPTPQPSLIKFSNPTRIKSTNTQQFCWNYTTASSPNIVLTISCDDPSSPGNIKSFNTTFQATTLSTRAVSYPDQTKCRIIQLKYSNGTFSYFLAQYAAANNTLEVTYALDSVLASLTATVSITNLPMMLSPNCDRFKVGSNPKYVYHKVNNTFQPASNSGFFMASLTDQNLTYALYGPTIWKYDTAQSQYISYFNQSTLYTPTILKAYQNSVIIVASNSTSSAAGVQVLAFIDQNGNFTQFFNASFFLDQYKSVNISSKLTKVALIEYVPSTLTYWVKMYHLDFNNKQSSIIHLPERLITQYASTTFNLFDQYLHTRQDGFVYYGDNPRENVFYFYNDVVPQLTLFRQFTKLAANIFFLRSTIIVINSSIYLANQLYSSSQTYVNLFQLNLNRAMVSNYLNPAINVFYSGGVIKLCPPGCSQCSNQICTACANGFSLNINTGICRRCSQGATACDSLLTITCSSCGVGYYFTDIIYSCNRCSPKFVDCTGADNPYTCYPGNYIDATLQCKPCSRNCLQCSSATACTLCRRGFVATANGTCRGCSLFCSSCLAENITQCTACAIGLELQGYQCIQCPANCHVCKKGYCQTCAIGYTPKLGACSLNCKLPCATCAQGQPSTCLTCFGSNILSGSTCVFNISCNATADCTDCGQIFGLFLFEFNCYPCSSVAFIPNCIQCSQFNQYHCVICEDGYFVSQTGRCQICRSICKTCNNNSTCTSCINASYTHSLNQTDAVCLACEPPCATCSGDPTYCLTCVNGYTKKFWKCQNNTFIGFSLTLSGAGVDTSQILISIDAIIAALLTGIAENLTNIEVITINTVVSASVIISGTIAPSSGDTSTASSALSASLSNGTIAGFTITASSITLEGSSQSSSSSLKTESIIGLAVGVFCFLVIILILIVCMCKQKPKRSRRVMDQFSQKQRNNFSFFDAAAVRDQPSREMIVVEDLTLRRRRRRRQ